MDQQLSVEARVKECFAEMLGLSVSEIDLSSTLSELVDLILAETNRGR